MYVYKGIAGVLQLNWIYKRKQFLWNCFMCCTKSRQFYRLKTVKRANARYNSFAFLEVQLESSKKLSSLGIFHLTPKMFHVSLKNGKLMEILCKSTSKSV